MDLLSIIILGIFLFFIITGAVRVAIDPLVKSDRNIKSVKNDMLYRLRDNGIITEQDISEYIDSIRGLKDFEEVKEDFIDAKHVLKTLYSSDRISLEDYNIRLDKLKSSYNME